VTPAIDVNSAAQTEHTDEEPIDPTSDTNQGSTNQGSHRNHYTQFKRYLRRNISYVQRMVAATNPPLAEEMRQQALHTLSYAFGEADLWPLVRELLQALAPKMELAGHREDWLPYLQRGREESERFGDATLAAECNLQIGIIYRLLSDFAEARKNFTASIAHAAQNQDIHNQARGLNELAWLEHLQHHYVDAIKHSSQALEILPEADVEQAMSYRVLGMVAIDREEWEKAEQLHRDALSIFRLHGDQRRAAWSVQNLAYALRGQQKYENAVQYYQEALSTLQDVGDYHSVAVVQFNLGITYYHSGNIEQAIRYFEQAVTAFKQFNNRLFLARIHTDLGLAYLEKQHFEAAENAFSTSIYLFNELNDTSWALNAMDGMGMTYIASQQYKKAEKILAEAVALLPLVVEAPNYQYLRSTLLKHLEESRRGQVDSSL